MITRNALIINCPGSGENYLPGTQEDVQNVFNFLRSPVSGSFYDEEISYLGNPTWDEAEQYIDQFKADYQVIYFTGHGASRHNERLLQFKDDLIPDIWLLNNNPRQLIIVDACRNYLATIGAIPQAEDQFINFDGVSDSRRIFDQFIQNSPAGKMIVHATHAGAYSYDSRSGGAFTYNLLTLAYYREAQGNFQPYYINQLLPIVKNNLRQQGYNQSPCIPYQTGNLNVPFMIDAPQIITKKSIGSAQPVQESNENPLIALGVCVALGVGLFHLFKNS